MTRFINEKGFSLVELTIAVGILAFVLTGLLTIFINCLILNATNRGITLAYNAIQTKMEEIKNTNFDCLDTSSCIACSCPTSLSCPTGCSSCFRNNCRFDLDGFPSSDAQGKIEITQETTNLKRVRIVASFLNRNRVIGEDLNLNGTLDSGEDKNDNGQLDSPVELVTLIAK